MVTKSQESVNIVGTWIGYDQTNWEVTLVFKKDNTLRVMLREFTWDTPYRIDYSTEPISIDIDDFEKEIDKRISEQENTGWVDNASLIPHEDK
jgi:hypothetical protein